MKQSLMLLCTCISEAKLQFSSTWFVKIRFPLLQFIADRVNHPGTILILPMLMDVQPIIVVTVEGNVLALNNLTCFKSKFEQ